MSRSEPVRTIHLRQSRRAITLGIAEVQEKMAVDDFAGFIVSN